MILNYFLYYFKSDFKELAVLHLRIHPFGGFRGLLLFANGKQRPGFQQAGIGTSAKMLHSPPGSAFSERLTLRFPHNNKGDNLLGTESSMELRNSSG